MDDVTDNEKLLQIARERADEAASAAMVHNDRAKQDLEFAAGRQWPDDVRAAREENGQPCLTINASNQFIRRVTDMIRRMNPAVRVAAADSAATKEVAEIYEGLIRAIEYKWDAPSVYEGAAEQAAQCGIGWFRVRADYEPGDTFDQECVIERVYNPFAVVPDPVAKHPNRIDMRYCFVMEEMPRAEFEAAYPDVSANPLTEEHKNTLSTTFNWSTTDTVTVAEYFWIEYEDRKIAQLPTGEVILASQLPPGFKAKTRTVKHPKVMWAKITGDAVLEGPQEFPSRYIPVIAVTGEEIHIGEEIYRSSVIRWAKDPMMLYNYAASANAEVTGMQPKAPFMVTLNQIAGLESYWNQANKANLPYLPYNPDEKAAPPQRMQPPMSSEGLLTAMQIAAEDIKRTTGIYDASLGARSNETSGVAIEKRQQEADAATSIYADNMVKAVRHCGTILVDMIPRVYDRNRVVVILGEDGQEKLETINGLMASQDGEIRVNDVTVGKFAVRIQVGQSHSSKREAAAQGMMEFLRVNPAAAPLISDLIAKMQDWPESDRVAERLRATLPPQLQDETDGDMTPEEQMQRQQAMMQAQQQQQAAQMLQMRKAEAEVKEAEAKAAEAEAEAVKARIEAEAMMTQRAVMASAMTAGPMMPGAPM